MITRSDDLWNAEFEVRPGAPTIVRARRYPDLKDLSVPSPITATSYNAAWNRYDPKVKAGQNFITSFAGSFDYVPVSSVGITVAVYVSIDGKVGTAGTIYEVCPEQQIIALSVPDTWDDDDPDFSEFGFEYKCAYYMSSILYDCDRLRITVRFTIGGGSINSFYINPYYFYTYEGQVLAGTIEAPPAP